MKLIITYPNRLKAHINAIEILKFEGKNLIPYLKQVNKEITHFHSFLRHIFITTNPGFTKALTR